MKYTVRNISPTYITYHTYNGELSVPVSHSRWQIAVTSETFDDYKLIHAQHDWVMQHDRSSDITIEFDPRNRYTSRTSDYKITFQREAEYIEFVLMWM